MSDDVGEGDTTVRSKIDVSSVASATGEGRRRRKREVAALGEKWSAGNIYLLRENTNERESGVDDYRELADLGYIAHFERLCSPTLVFC